MSWPNNSRRRRKSLFIPSKHHTSTFRLLAYWRNGWIALSCHVGRNRRHFAEMPANEWERV